MITSLGCSLALAPCRDCGSGQLGGGGCPSRREITIAGGLSCLVLSNVNFPEELSLVKFICACVCVSVSVRYCPSRARFSLNLSTIDSNLTLAHFYRVQILHHRVTLLVSANLTIGPRANSPICQTVNVRKRIREHATQMSNTNRIK